MYIITIDSGTSNSRLYLIDADTQEVVDVSKKNVGVKDTATSGTNLKLKQALNSGIQELLTRNSCHPEDIRYIIASGMITSNLGIVEVPHVVSPCSIDELAKASVVQVLPEFFNIPCLFIAGMKNSISLNESISCYDALNQYDVMRGEEVESIGLIKQLNLEGKGLLILPGSHNKYVLVNNNTFQSCLSTLSGEMLFALQKDTILSSSLSEDLVKEVNYDALLKGYQAGCKYGISRALYHVRLLHLNQKMDENNRANFLLGAVISSDVQAFQVTYHDIHFDWMVVGGSKPLRKAFAYILNYLNYTNVIEATDAQVKNSTIIGSVEVSYQNSEINSIQSKKIFKREG